MSPLKTLNNLSIQLPGSLAKFSVLTKLSLTKPGCFQPNHMREAVCVCVYYPPPFFSDGLAIFEGQIAFDCILFAFTQTLLFTK